MAVSELSRVMEAQRADSSRPRRTRLGCVSFMKILRPLPCEKKKKKVQLQREVAMIGQGFRGIRLTAALMSQSVL